MPVDALGCARAGMADQVGDFLGRYAIGREHADERVPQFPWCPRFPEACLVADSPEVAAHVPGAAGSAGRAGEDEIMFLSLIHI